VPVTVSEFAWSLGAAERARLRLADLVSLTKPRIVQLLVVTGATTAAVAAGGWPGAGALVAVAVGGGLAGAGAASINCALEGDLDRRMPRTSQRPVAAGRISARLALVQGVGLNLLAAAVIVGTANWLAAALALAGTLWYVFVYTLWLKPRTAQNIVVGGLAGSFPPLVGWAAVTGSLGWTAVAFAAVIFLWTPPHFWALATLAEDDYRHGGVPMLPVVAGARRTARAMLVYAVATVAVSLVPVLVGDLQTLYLAVAVGSGAWLVAACWKHLRRLLPASARAAFFTSLGYLGMLFASAATDSLVF
jgi:protoheme IX farnesyltransferase